MVMLPETLAATRAARQGRIQTSLNLAYGSSLASIGLTIPAIALASIWLKGPLLLDGHGTFSRASASFQGTASATPEQRDNLAGLLNLLGRPVSPGTVALTFMH